MPKCTSNKVEFGRLRRREISANFDGRDISAEGGVLLLRQVDRRIGLTTGIASVLTDARDPARIMPQIRRQPVTPVVCCSGAQYTPYTSDVHIPPPAARNLHHRRPCARPITSIECCPGMLKNNGGKGELCLEHQSPTLQATQAHPSTLISTLKPSNMVLRRL